MNTLVGNFTAVVWVALGSTCSSVALGQAPADPPLGTHSIVVLYDPVTAAARPAQLVSDFGRGQLPPAVSAELGDPLRVAYVVRDRLSDAVASRLPVLNAHALLDRYVVLDYGSAVPAAGLATTLRRLRADPQVLWADYNRPVRFSATPTDPLYGGAPPADERGYQWGLPRLSLPAAWDLQRGNAYVGIVDTGIQTTHPDLIGHPDLYPYGFFRQHLSWDFGNGDGDVEEYDLGSNTRGHGTHVAGIVGAVPNNELGVAGICWGCSLMIGKIINSMQLDPAGTEAAAVAAIRDLAASGAQVLNLSFQAEWTNSASCATAPFALWCLALQAAADYKVMLVNSAGNVDYTSVPIHEVAPPGTDPRVVSVGALDFANARPAFAHFGARLDFVAPGVHVLSTFYTGALWNPAYECGDVFSTAAADGFGPCSGTSMSAPHVTGLFALIRSSNPLLDFVQTKRILATTTNTALPPHSPPSSTFVDGLRHSPEFGHGLPNAASAVKVALGSGRGTQLNNRLTPLFSFYSAQGEGYFYSTVPQMARAAVWGTLRPHPAGGAVTYQAVGPAVIGYTRYPGPACSFSPCPYDPTPSASVFVLTTHKSPLPQYPDTDIVPLYRMSWADTVPGSRDVRHTYTTSVDGIRGFKVVGFKVDGIEGYVWKCGSSPQPTGTVRLYRKFNPLRGDYAIFPESELLAKLAEGYTDNATGPGPNVCPENMHQYIGFAYPNQDADADGIVDGMEALLGTCVGVRDTHPNGIPGVSFDTAAGTYLPTVSCAARAFTAIAD